MQTPEELEQADNTERVNRLQSFGQTLGRQRDQWIRARYALGVDKRWVWYRVSSKRGKELHLKEELLMMTATCLMMTTMTSTLMSCLVRMMTLSDKDVSYN